MSLGQIIRKKREVLHLTLDEVAAMTGFSKPYLSTIETCRVNNPPSDKLLTRLEECLKFKSGELLKIAHLEAMPPDIRQDYENMDARNKQYRQIIRDIAQRKIKTSKLPELLSEYDIELEETEDKQGDKPEKVVPIINKVTAGYPAEFDDMGYPVGIADDYVRCPDIHDPNAFAVRIVGDLMEPKFSEGDIVIFSPAAEVQNGDDCFIRLRMPHETTFKRVFFDQEDRQQIRLQPRNDMLPPVIVEGSRINGMYRAVMYYKKL